MTRITRIGLDISPGSVRAVQLRRVGQTWSITHAVENNSPSLPTTDEGEAQSQPVQLYWDGIRDCIQRSDFSGRKVNAVLSSPDIELHPLELPEMASQSENRLDDVVRWELKRLATPDLNDIESAHWPLPEGTARSPNVFGVAASRESVISVIQHCREAGLDCVGVDASPCALTRAVSILDERSETDVWGILDLGRRQSRLLICVGDTPVLARSAGPGGEEWTQCLSRELKLSAESAEIHKCDHGITHSSRGFRRESGSGQSVGSSTPESELGSIQFGVLRGLLTKLVAEVERSFFYIIGCYPSCKTRDLVIVGGGAAMLHLPEYLGEALGIPVRRAGDFLGKTTCRLRSEVKMREPFERYVAAIGLALDHD